MRFYQFRRAMRRVRRRNSDPATLAAIDTMFADDEICTECCCAAEELFESSAGGPFMAFFKFIIENQEAILKFVMAIVAMFTSEKETV